MSRNVIDAVGLGEWLVGFLGLASFTTMYLYLRKRLQRKSLSLFCHLDIQLLNRGAKTKSRRNIRFQRNFGRRTSRGYF